MGRTATSERTVLETILAWSQERPAWQRDALRRIISKGPLDATDITELLQLCKEGRAGAGTSCKPEPLAKAHLPANPGTGSSVSLHSVADVEGVNNLASGQTLAFEQDGITIIYGDNGAGKSGYARILKRACRARHAGRIEANIYASQTPPPRASATIRYSIGGVQQPPEKWIDADHPHQVLSAVSVFDSDCASVHLKEKNEVAFRPFGLDIPDELAHACQTIKDALTAEQKQLEKARNPVFAKPTWSDTTAVGKLLASLRHDSDMKRIEALATLTENEQARLARLRADLSKQPEKAAAEQFLRADNATRLLSAVKMIEDKTTDASLRAVASAAQDAMAKRAAAELAAAKAFSGEPLQGIGGEVWRLLWDAARRYSTEVAYPGQAFPAEQADARCVLCQQTLDTTARDRMTRFEDFIQRDTERQAQNAETASKSMREALLKVSISSRALRSALQGIALEDPDLAIRTRQFIASARLRRFALLKAVEAHAEPALPVAAPVPTVEIAQLEAKLRAYGTELQKAASAEERKKLDAELAELRDRELLAAMMQLVRDEVERLKNIQFLSECLADTSTTAITKIGNEIADTVITPKLRDRFQQEIIRLAADKVRVEIVRSGGKYGSPQYQVRLFAKPEAKVNDVLSEGEKTCVALAAFLTELATATHTSTLVFDDPVCSLDHRWRKQVAKRLVEEAEHRQIVVFTHDLIFVNDLYDLGQERKRALRLLTVSRGQPGAGVVAEGMPWKGQRVEDRLDKLEKAARAAKQTYDNNEQEEYNREAAAIYNGLRASWERAVEDVAFFRVVQRHRDYIETKHLKKVSVLSEQDCDSFHAGYKRCCDVVDAHDPSTGRNADAPPPHEILQDIQVLKDWVTELREKQKKIA